MARQKKPTRRMNFVIDAELADSFIEHAEIDHRTASQLLRQWVEEYVKDANKRHKQKDLF